MSVSKCPHGIFTHSISNRCPICFGVDAYNSDAIPINGHGNGWLLRKDDLVCPECGGPRTAGWGAYDGSKRSAPPDPKNPNDWPPTCYACTSGNSKAAIAKRTAHEAQRGVRKTPGAK